jgi:RNA polymerase sigma-70 factor (ECF subfamily)
VRNGKKIEIIKSWIMENAKEKNNRKNFENLFSEYSDVIYRLCLYKTSKEDVAHDLTQETFLRLWKTISSNKDITKPKQYIYQITRNLIVDYYKRNKEVSLDVLQEEGFEPKSEEGSAEILFEVSMLKEAIEGLDQEFRDVIYMKFVEGMKVQEIAEILDISENLVSVRINRGKKKLDEKFK